MSTPMEHYTNGQSDISTLEIKSQYVGGNVTAFKNPSCIYHFRLFSYFSMWFLLSSLKRCYELYCLSFDLHFLLLPEMLSPFLSSCL